MAKLHLTLACGDYDRTKTLQDGSLDPVGIALNYLPMEAEEIFWRMGHHQEFDASEMSLSNYITMTSRGESPFTAIPIFPSRYFRHSCVFINTARGLDKPEDLGGKRIGVAEYAMTAAVWIRGFLSDDHGVAAKDVAWFTGGQEVPGRKERIELRLPPEIKVQPIPDDRTLNDMLDKGGLDALVTARIPSCFAAGAPHIRRLFPDFKSVEIDYYRRTQLFPIMHTVVIRNDVYEADPWVARSLYNAFCQSKDDAIDAHEHQQHHGQHAALAPGRDGAATGRLRRGLVALRHRAQPPRHRSIDPLHGRAGAVDGQCPHRGGPVRANAGGGLQALVSCAVPTSCPVPDSVIRAPSVIPAKAGIQAGWGGEARPWHPSTTPGFPLSRE